MVARLLGATLGLFAFAVTATAGLFSRNPVETILSRSIFASIIFCVLGLVLGGVAQLVIADHKRQRALTIQQRHRDDVAEKIDESTPDGSQAVESLADAPVG